MPQRVGWFWPRLVALLAAGLGLVGAGCSGGDGDATDHDPSAAHADTDDLVDQPGASTAGALPACLGERASGRLAHGLPYLDLTVGLGADARTGAFLLDWGTTRSTIDLAAFPAPGPLARDCPLLALGERCSFDDLSFFGSWGRVTLTTADHSAFDDTAQGGLRQAGILGTDFFATAVYSVDFGEDAGAVYHAAPGTFCDDTTLTGAGFRPLSSEGYYASDFSALKPISSVMEGASGGSVPNVPTVPLRVGQVIAPTQLDTGFADERVPHSINVNEAFFAAVNHAHPDALSRAPELDLALTTCVGGLAEVVEAYRVAPAYEVRLETATSVSAPGGDAGASVEGAVVFVKHTPFEARRCGGIGTWDVPAAQIGASFFEGHVMSFDPLRGLVWMR